MATLGKTVEFNSNHGNMEQYLEQLEQYFKASSIEENSEEIHK